ncbi:MAG: hypothetical protein Q7S09_01045 [bacterium]|nr:hypothetical protein [bacterium]
MGNVHPIKTSEVAKAKQAIIPDIVFEAFNELIVSKFIGYSATIRQKEVTALLEARGVDITEAYEKHWLDVEGAYRKAGWRVEYDKPGYSESYEAFFVFSKKEKGREY